MPCARRLRLRALTRSTETVMAATYRSAGAACGNRADRFGANHHACRPARCADDTIDARPALDPARRTASPPGGCQRHAWACRLQSGRNQGPGQVLDVGLE